ncbi:gfo/Idh/MocA family oxidoreductase, partial [bacterium]|nr:gfo/Idh/MocA family oxidoreductase [bacterium]
IPETAMDSFERPPRTLPRSNGHHRDWIDACKGGRQASSHFGVSGPMTEAVMLGIAAIRTGAFLEWDADALRVTNCPDAESLIRPPFREGWTL